MERWRRRRADRRLGFDGSYLTATSTFYQDETTAAEYGIFSSDWSGGTWYQDYTSNFNDSGFYIGACQQVCDQTVNDVWSEYNALGYSGTNSGGQLVVENSQFDNNEDGFDTGNHALALLTGTFNILQSVTFIP